MDREDVIKMAEEVGAVHLVSIADRGGPRTGIRFRYDALERFAELVAAAEREACLEACAPYEGDHYVNLCVDAIRARG